jgi:hypothetical protein
VSDDVFRFISDDEFLEQFRLATRGRRWGRLRAYCPVHDDNDASLWILVNDDGRLVKCFAGCGWSDVLAKAGLPPWAQFRDRRAWANDDELGVC